MAYTVTDERKKQFAGVYVLDRMVNGSLSVPLLLEGAEADLEPVMEYLMMKGYVEIHDDEAYRPADTGRRVLERFGRRYRDFLTHFDVYCAVDLAAGEFAFARFFDFDSERQWRAYLDDERWEDLRIPVAVYKGLDPVEVVFMSFLRENRFGRRDEGWQFDLLLGTIWDEMVAVCDTAPTLEELGYTADDGERVSGEAVLRDVIAQGAALTLELRERERREDGTDEHGGEDDDEVYTETVRYREDPGYAAPWWSGVVFL
jgi:hypothetical protein